MTNGHRYPRDWENVNSALLRLRVPKGWLVVTTVKLLVGGKDWYTASQPLFISDEDMEWLLETE